MQSVADRWYVIYARFTVALATVISLLCAAVWLLPRASFLQHWGFSYVTFTVALLIIAYFVAIYRRQVEHGNAYNGTLVLSLLLSLDIINLMQLTGRLHSTFLAAWLIVVLMSGMFGSYVLGGYAFFITSYFVLINTDMPGHTRYDLFAIGAVTFTWILCAASHFLWKRFYVNRESLQVGQLNKLLKSKQLQSEALIQAIGDGIVVTDTDGKIMLINPAAAAMVEWTVADAVGLNVRAVLVFNNEEGEPLPETENPFQKIMNLVQPASMTVTLVSKENKKRVVSLVISPVFQQGTQELAAVVAVFRDVTVAHAQEQRSADFISTASHEMRTPVAAIEGYLALALNEHVSKIDTKARSYLEKAHESTQHLGQLFQDLLTSAKAEDGRLVSHPVVVEMGTYLEQLTDSLKFAAQKKGLISDFTIGTSNSEGHTTSGGRVVRPLYYVLADPDRLREVITNLFDNAVKYTDSGKISIGLTGNDKVVQLFIRDTGNGIPADDIPHLFQKFYRVDNSATRTVGGTGLGLFICRKIIELYNGRIWVESTFGQGSTFFINMPRVSSSKALEMQQQQAGGQALNVTK